MSSPSTPRPDPSRHDRDRGSSVLLVLACLTAVAMFATVAISSAVATLRTADRSGSWNQALSAAEAGVADYLARLNRNDQYWQGVDCANPALRGPATGSNSCGWRSTTQPGWSAVPGSTDASYHYDVDVSATYSTGSVRLVSTGRVGTITRSVEVRLRRGGFGEFLYYTVYETIDPADEKQYGVSNATAQTYCPRYNWPSLPDSQRRPYAYGRDGRIYCSRISFITGDTINGPMHTNDAFVVTGSPRFRGTTTTSNPACRGSEAGPAAASSCYLNGGSASPAFERGIGYQPEIELPTTLGDLRQHVTPSRTSAPGCLYTGPTRIKFLPTSGSATPQMQVWSKWTTSAQLNPGCGATGTATNRLGSSGGQTVAVPQDRLIYVQDVPSSQSSPSSNACKTTGGIGDGIPVAGTSGTYPDYDVNLSLREADCRYGTVYVQGTLKGRSTVVAENNVVVTDDLRYAGARTGTDTLGLIATNSVKVYHPVRCTRREDGECDRWANLSTAQVDIEVNAAILTLQHSFAVQSYYLGDPLGTLKLFGSFAQRFRGPVGTNSSGGGVVSGYLKDYTYDTRLRYAPPPFFLDPVRSGWGQKTFGELTPRYR